MLSSVRGAIAILRDAAAIARKVLVVARELAIVAVVLATAWLVASSLHGWATDLGNAPDCSGRNGNAAVAACHPTDQAVQDACPDNSYGRALAAPTDACLEAVRSAGT